MKAVFNTSPLVFLYRLGFLGKALDEFHKNLLAINFRVRKDIFDEIMK